MRALELTGIVDAHGNLVLDEPINKTSLHPEKVRVIVLFQEPTEIEEDDPDDTPVEEIKASLKRALQQAKEGKRIPLAEMWEGIDVE